MDAIADTASLPDLLEWADSECRAISISAVNAVATRMWRVRLSLEARQRHEADPSAARRLAERIAAIREAREKLGERALIGVGTVLDANTCRAAIAAGAEFVVTPICRTELVAIAHAAGCPITRGSSGRRTCLAASAPATTPGTSRESPGRSRRRRSPRKLARLRNRR